MPIVPDVPVVSVMAIVPFMAIVPIEHFQQVFDVFQELEALFIDPVLGDRVAYHCFIDKSSFGKVIKIALQLAVTHIGAVHDFGFTRFAQPQDIGHYLYIGPSIVHSFCLFLRLSCYGKPIINDCIKSIIDRICT